MSTRRAGTGTIAVLLLIAGVVLAALFRLVSGTEHHAYAPSGAAPVPVRVQAGESYRLAMPGGVQAALAGGVGQLPGKDGGPARLALRCTWSVDDTAAQDLTLTAEPIDTKAVNQVATFTAPADGMLRVRCAGWGQMYIAGAGSGDPAGWLLLAAITALTLGAALGLSALRTALSARPHPTGPPPPRDLPSPAPRT